MSFSFLSIEADRRIAYDDQGAGPLVVCLPGLGDLRQEYRFVAPQLAAAGYRVVSMDLRGHGDSSPHWHEYSLAAIGRDLLALLRHLDAGPAALLGTSMGAAVNVWAAVEAPELVSGLVMLGPAVHGEVSRAQHLLYAALFARPWGPALWIKYFTSLFPGCKPTDFDAYTAALRRSLQQPGRLAAMRALIFASKAESEARLPQLRRPVQIIMGSRDADFKDPAAEARWIAARLSAAPTCDVQLIDGVGHYPHVENPGAALPLITAFLAQIYSK